MQLSYVHRLWLPGIAPLHLLLACGVMAVIGLIFSVWLSIQSPWLGIEWRSVGQEAGLVVTKVNKGPALGKLRSGDTILAFEGIDGKRVVLDEAALLEDPDFSPTYAGYNRFLGYQHELYDVFTQANVIAILADGRRIALVPAVRTPVLQLPGEFWIMHLFGIGAFLIGVGVWSFRRGEPATRLFVLSGLGYAVAVFCAAIYTSRELVMNPQWFQALAVSNHFGNMLFGYSALALLWYCPQHLGRLPVVRMIYFSMLLIWINETLQLFEWPFHTYYLQFNFPFIFGVFFAVFQWRKARGQPLERAALKWFLLSIFISIGLTMLFFFIPVVFQTSPLVSIFTANGIIFSMYVGLALGVTRYRLFNLERWWLATWVWFFGGLLVILVDLALVYALNLRPLVALGFAILVGGWVYFPLRQWLWGKFIRSPKQMLDQYLPELMEMFILTSSVREFSNQWSLLLSRIFDPLNISEQEQIIDATRIRDNGLILLVPALSGQGSVKLACGNRGGRLFVPEDVRLADAILGLARKSANLREAQEKGASEERDRIMRDLHDDVGAKLLTLVHRAQSPENAQVARSALQTLRDTIYCLNEQAAAPLDEALADWRAELQDRIVSANIVFGWQQLEDLPVFVLTPRQRINLGRILHEAVSNVIRHAHADRIEIAVKVNDDSFQITISDNGHSVETKDWLAGTGMNNIRHRVEELGGGVQWCPHKSDDKPGQTGSVVDIRFPWLGGM